MGGVKAAAVHKRLTDRDLLVRLLRVAPVCTEAHEFRGPPDDDCFYVDGRPCEWKKGCDAYHEVARELRIRISGSPA